MTDNERLILLLRPYYSVAIQYCLALTKDGVEAEDLFHDALIKAMKKIGSLQNESSFKSWLFKIITTTHLDRKRKLKFRLWEPVHAKILELPELIEEDRLEYRVIVLREALKKLTEKERIAITLYELGGLTVEQIRVIQKEKSDSAIKSRLSRTRQKLRNIIIELENKIHHQTKAGVNEASRSI